MGFQKTLTALLSHLPKSRQTLLFSATQTQSVSDLARLSLKDPVKVGVEETLSEGATPKALEQHYVVCELDKKLDVLWSFIKSHLQAKTLVFMSSCKQVRFVFETFCKMHPGTPLLHLHGKQKQMTRLATFQRFTSMKHAVLFATDIAARGLDFPSVDWVLQVDAPEDAETYIHRVGRTARYESAGKGLLLLTPSEEEGMVAALKKKNIDIQKIKIKASKTQSISNQLQNLAFQDPEIKYLGQRVRYVVSALYSCTSHNHCRRLCLICALCTCKRTSRFSNSTSCLSSALLKRSDCPVCRRSSFSARKWRRSGRTRRVPSQSPQRRRPRANTVSKKAMAARSRRSLPTKPPTRTTTRPVRSRRGSHPRRRCVQ